MGSQTNFGLQQSEIINPVNMNKNMDHRTSINQIGLQNNLNYDSNIPNAYASHNPQMYMSTRGPMTGRMMNTYGINDNMNKTSEGFDSQTNIGLTSRKKSTRKSNSKKNFLAKSKSRKFKSKNNRTFF